MNKKYNLPKSWDEISLKVFQRLTTTTINDNSTGDNLEMMNSNVELLSKLLNVPIEELEELTMNQILVMMSNLHWMETPPEKSKTTTIKWKNIDEISYNDYVTFIMNPEPLQNLHTFIKSFSLTTMSENEILDISVPESLLCFFLFRKKLNKYLNRSKMKLRLKIIWLKIRELFNRK